MSDLGIDFNLLGSPEYLATIGVTPDQIVSPPSTTPASTGPTTVGGLTASQLSGTAVITAILRDAGLDSPDLIQYVKDLATSGITTADMQQRLQADLYDPASTPGKIVAQKFPAIFARQKAGLPPITVGDYLSYKNTLLQLGQKYGLPAGLVNDQSIDKQLALDISPNENEANFQLYQQAAYQTPQQDLDELYRLYGITPGDLTGLHADKPATTALLQQRFLAAQESGAAVRSGFGALTQSEAEQFAAAGVTPTQALQGTGKLVGEQELFQSLPGENADTIDRATQLGGTLGGNAQAQQRIAQRVAARKAQMEQNAAFAVGKTGIEGLGVSTT